MTNTTRTTQDSSTILVEGDIRSTCNNASDAIRCLGCLDFEAVGQRNGASFGLFALLETISGALDAVSGRYESEEETEAEYPAPVFLSKDAHESLLEYAEYDEADGLESLAKIASGLILDGIASDQARTSAAKGGAA